MPRDKLIGVTIHYVFDLLFYYGCVNCYSITINLFAKQLFSCLPEKV